MLKKIVFALVAILIIIQFFPAEKINPVESAPITIQGMELKSILETSCMDCHSNKTVWPWYSNVAPISWNISDHVKHGRDELNFSEWENYSTKKKVHKLEELIEEVEEGHMPIDSYTWLHSGSDITIEEFKLLESWAKAEIAALQAPVESAADSLDQ